VVATKKQDRRNQEEVRRMFRTEGKKLEKRLVKAERRLGKTGEAGKKTGDAKEETVGSWGEG
jgi:hypothetical protein